MTADLQTCDTRSAGAYFIREKTHRASCNFRLPPVAVDERGKTREVAVRPDRLQGSELNRPLQAYEACLGPALPARMTWRASLCCWDV